MPNLFKEILPSILQTKKSVINNDIDEKDYNPFLINRALSLHLDSVLYANEMNMNNQLDKDMQYQYLLHSVRAMKRKFQPWQKSEIDKDIDCVKTYFGYSNQKAKEALRILTKEQLEVIRNKTDLGGTKK